jgi:flagellar hook protein FlgE
MGYAAGANGAIVASTPVDLQIATTDVAPSPTTDAEVKVNLDSRAALLNPASFDVSDTSTYSAATSMSVYDSLGNPHTMSVYFVKTAANTWSVFAANDGVQMGAAALGTLVFQNNGALDTAASTLPMTASTALANGASSPFSFTIDLSDSTQFGASFGVNALEQDGYTSGRLSGFSIDRTGVVVARYSNGQTRAQGQVVLANLTNPQGQRPLGSNRWAETKTSGPELIGAPSTGNLGGIQSGALEDSNVDLTAELVSLITAQRVYQANAQSIKTMDSVLQTLVNMR